MSGTEEQIEIDLGDLPKKEEPKSEEPIVEIIDEGASEVEASSQEEDPKDVEKALKKLNKKLEQERQARLEAEERARIASQQAQQAAGEVTDTNLHLVASAIDTLNRDQEILKTQLRDSMAIGDFDRAAEIQAAMTSNFSKLGQLERGLEEMKNIPRPQIQPMQKTELGVEDLIDRVTPKSAEWLRANKEHLPDARSLRVMARAHEDALDYGIQPESDAYFRFVENRLGINGGKAIPEVEDAMSGAAKVTKNRQSPPSAPVSRNPVNAEGNRPGVVRLTAAEVEAAKISGISPQEYYKLKMEDRNRN